MAIGLNFIAIGENYTSFPEGSKTSFLYLIEISDKLVLYVNINIKGSCMKKEDVAYLLHLE